jgi:hypothetical protein
MFLGVAVCNQNSALEKIHNKSHLIQNTKIDVNLEIQKWKQNLIENSLIGNPCYFRDREELDSLDCVNWYKNNPNQLDGFPCDDKEIKSVVFDIDNDFKEDLLLYFIADNCTRHNGNPKTYATIIYSKNNKSVNLMDEIILSIQSKYNQLKDRNNSLKTITDSYLETSTTIDRYNNGIIVGKFKLYSENDPHCCPSYKGFYSYDIKNKSMVIEILEYEK